MQDDRLADAVLTIDLDAIMANWSMLRERARPAECAAVVKADAYGLGAERVAPTLAKAGCKSFYVAQLGEGIALRRALPEAAIYVTDGVLAGAEGELAAHRLVPVLNSLEQLERWSGFARGGKRLETALHIDTGMNRLGLSASDVERLAAEPGRLAGLALGLAITHLVSAEEQANPLNEEQLARFQLLRAKLPPCRAGIAASSGIFLGPRFHLDQVRPGAALWGIAPQVSAPNPMRQVVELHGQIVQVRDVDRGGTVGYGATHRLRRPSRIATVGVGYADGYLRALANRGAGYLGDHAAPLVGRVSMDLVTLDATDVPAELVHPGARVELLGPHRTADQMAADAGTNGYEILTNFGRSRRFQRRYRRAGDAGGDGR
ncbi:MAG TPA: alanine racemase [Alphaproteobacteria bacterium]|nr:alanine racemase [Alphaproteobacteria bacterium]